MLSDHALQAIRLKHESSSKPLSSPYFSFLIDTIQSSHEAASETETDTVLEKKAESDVATLARQVRVNGRHIAKVFSKFDITYRRELRGGKTMYPGI